MINCVSQQYKIESLYRGGDIILLNAPVAQRTERGSPKAEVVGSTPAWGASQMTCGTDQKQPANPGSKRYSVPIGWGERRVKWEAPVAG